MQLLTFHQTKHLLMNYAKKIILYSWMNKKVFPVVLLLCFQCTLYDVGANEKQKEPLQDSNSKGNLKSTPFHQCQNLKF